MKEMLRKSDQNYDELALDYQAAGFNKEAEDIWQIAISEGATTPMTYYYMGRYAGGRAGRPDYCFPNRPEDVIALEAAKRENPKGAKAPYYLGCLYYAARQYDLAIENWELSARIDSKFPTVWRNLALARFNKQGKEQEALEYMERAFQLDENDERVLMELDQLYKRLHRPHAERLAFLQKYPELIRRRDDLVLEEITLLNEVGRYEEAMQKLDAHIFHPWEGGEGKVPTQYQICRVELAKKAILSKEYDKSIKLLKECLEYPHHLGEGKLYGAQENDFYYLLGIAYDAKGETAKAKECWEEATKGPQEPAAAMYYNDAKPDKIFYQGLALLKARTRGRGTRTLLPPHQLRQAAYLREADDGLLRRVAARPAHLGGLARHQEPDPLQVHACPRLLRHGRQGESGALSELTSAISTTTIRASSSSKLLIDLKIIS